MNRQTLIGCFGALALYLLLTVYLGTIDVFNSHFESVGPAMLFYNVCRSLSILYFVWIVIGTGWLVKEWLEKRAVTFTLGWWNGHMLSFLVGMSSLNIILFVLGLCGLYYRGVVLAITSPVLVYSYPTLIRSLKEGLERVKIFWGNPRADGSHRLLFITLLVSFCTLSSVLLLTRVLYPGQCGNDVYEHYLPYQRLVIQNHGLAPNDVWMQFYYTKGAGLTFLAMLISDDLGSQIANFVLLLFCCALIFSIVRHLTLSRKWGALVSIVGLSCFLFSNPQWGAFQSHHLGVMAYLLGTTWFAIFSLDRSDENLKAWFGFWILLGVAQTIFSAVSAVFGARGGICGAGGVV